MGKRNIGTSFIWKANRIKDLPTVVLHRHRKHPIKDHPQRYHVNIGKRYMKGNVNPRSSEIHFKKGNKNVIVKGVDKPKMKKTVYLTNGKDVAVVKAMSSDGKKLKVHIIGREGYEYVDPKEWRVLKVSGDLDSREKNRIIKGIRKAVREDPKRLIHGGEVTSKGEWHSDVEKPFWITKDGKIFSYRDFSKIPVKKDLIGVHSHSMEVSKKGEKSPFYTFTSRDIKVLQEISKRKYGDTIVVIMADGRMHILRTTKKTLPSFYKLKLSEIDDFIERTPSEKGIFRKFFTKVRDNLYPDTFYDDEFLTPSVHKENLRDFSKKYRLEYITSLRWK